MIEERLLKIDSTTINNHCYLDAQDLCYYFGDYYGRQGFGHSPMNQLIFNLKKPMDKKDTSSWQYKENAIKTIAEAIIGLKQWEKLRQYTWIPMPSSKVRGDPAYDDRLMKILTTIDKGAKSSLDIRDILTIKSNRLAAHDPQITVRPTVQDHLDNLKIDSTLLNPKPKAIVIFDDVITTGASFKAAKEILNNSFPQIPSIGIFIARNIPNQNLLSNLDSKP